MVVIRLRKPGKAIKGRTHYKIVVDEKNSKLDGKYIQQVGYYDPSKKPMLIKMDVEAIEGWIAKGAQPSDTIASLLKKYKKYPDGNIPEKAVKEIPAPKAAVEPTPEVKEDVAEEAAPEAEEKTEA